jgi:signal transduction histidine kinase/putative methionine-R-sulfoxide reductase with GAF domain
LTFTSRTSYTEVLNTILEQAQRLVPFKTANIMLLENGIMRLACMHGYKAMQNEDFMTNLVQRLADFPLDNEAVETRQPVVVPDVNQEPRWVRLAETDWIRSFIVVPICLGDRVLGLLRIDSHTPGTFSTQDADNLSPMASAAAIALENARLIEAEREQRQLSDALRKVGTVLSSSLDFDIVLDRLLDEIAEVVPFDTGNIMLVDGGRIRIARSRGYEAVGDDILRALNALNLDIATTPNLQRMVETGRSLVISDVASHPDWLDLEVGKHVGSWTGAPILVQGQAVAFFSLEKSEPGFYQPKHADRLTAFCSQAATAIENAQLYAEADRRAREMKVASDLLRKLNASPDVAETFPAILASLEAITGCERASLAMFDLSQEWFTVQALDRPRVRNKHGDLQKVEDSAASATILHDQPHLSPDLAAETAFRFEQELYQAGYRSRVSLPLPVGGRIIGALNMVWKEPAGYDPGQLPLLGQIADAIALALERGHLFAETRRQASYLEALNQVSQELALLRDLNPVLFQVIERALQLLDRNTGGIFLYRPEQEMLEWVVEAPDQATPKSYSLSRGEGLAGKVWDTGKSLIVNDFPNWPGKSPRAARSAGSAIGVPIQWGDDFLGVLLVTDEKQRPFHSEDANLLSQFATQAAIAIRNIRLFEQEQRHTAELEARVNERAFELRVLYELSLQIGYTLSYDELFQLTFAYLYRVIPFNVAGVCLLATESCEIFIQSSSPLSPESQEALESRLLATVSDLAGRAVDREQVTLTILDAAIFHQSSTILEELGSFFQVSLTIDEKTLGLLFVSLRTEDQFTGDRIRFTYTVANQVSQSLQRLHRLRAAERQRLENLVAHLPDGVLLFDSEDRLLVTNPAGFQALTVLNNTAIEGEVVTRLGPRKLRSILDRHNEPLPVEIALDGPPKRVFEAQARPIDQAVSQWVLTLREVTQEYAAQQQLQMQERLATVGQLAAGIAHDFNNILTSMMGFATLVRLDPSISEAAQRDLDRIVEQGQRAAQLIRQILDFSRQSIAEKRPLDLLPLAKETCKLLARTIPEDIKVELQFDPSHENYMLNADPVQLQQVLTNLALNARDAMENGGVMRFWLSKVTIDLSEFLPNPEMPPGDWLALSIEDTGTGIPAHVIPHIYEPFFTTKEVGQGTGLGLAQVYGIVKQHGGYINADSRPGQGTTFTIYLPVLPYAQPLPQEPPPVQLPHGTGQLLLVVEDELQVLQVIQTMLRRLDYRVMTATNGQDALEIYHHEKEDIELVLTDVTMPEMGGLALAESLRKLDPHVKVVALTGYPLGSADKELLSRGFVEWLQKPLKLELLARAIHRALKS